MRRKVDERVEEEESYHQNTPTTLNTLKNRDVPSSSSSIKIGGPSTSRNNAVIQPETSSSIQSGLGKGLPSKPSGSKRGNRSGMSNDNKDAKINNRRPSTVLKQARRTSQLRSGAIAYPHSNVPDFELYRHLADNVSDVQRMRYLATWSLSRGLENALTPPRVANPVAAPGALKGSRDKLKEKEKDKEKGKKRKDEKGEEEEEDGELKKLVGMEEIRWTENDRANLVRYRDVAEEIMKETMKDLTDGRISIGWFKEKDDVSIFVLLV